MQAGAPADRRPCDAEMAWSLRLLPPECPLFARKFPANTSSQARMAVGHLQPSPNKFVVCCHLSAR